MKAVRTLTCAVAAAVTLSGCAGMYTKDGSPNDPWEGFNRGVFAFNDTLDHYALRPVARGYDAVTPGPVQTGISNFFSNLDEVGNAANGVLQGNPLIFGVSVSRFLINSTLGIGGLLDPAGDMGIKERQEDLGKTLAAWGFKSGPFLMLPLLGPSTLRDTSSIAGDWFTDPVSYIDNNYAEWGLYFVDVVQMRAQLLDKEKLMQGGDRYTFIRDAWMQRRQFEIDGNKVTNDPFASGAGDFGSDDGAGSQTGSESATPAQGNGKPSAHASDDAGKAAPSSAQDNTSQGPASISPVH